MNHDQCPERIRLTEAWARFIAEGVLSPAHRSFAYRAKANFAPGFHLGVLREVD